MGISIESTVIQLANTYFLFYQKICVFEKVGNNISKTE